MGDYGVFLAGPYRCLGVIRALVSPSKSVSLGTHNPTGVLPTANANIPKKLGLQIYRRLEFFLIGNVLIWRNLYKKLNHLRRETEL